MPGIPDNRLWVCTDRSPVIGMPVPILQFAESEHPFKGVTPMSFKTYLLSTSAVSLMAVASLVTTGHAGSGEIELADAVSAEHVSIDAQMDGGGSCNPCAAKACNPCNPCAANPCNPCAGGALKVSASCVVPSVKAKAYNPCNPCAANPSNPCGGSVAAVEVSDAEARAAYDCLKPEMTAAFAGSTEAAGAAHLNWPHVSTGPYQSITHGGRYVSNTANDVAVVAYMKYEEIGKAPVGSILAKNSFAILEDGKAAIGPLFTMTKMEEGWNPETGDWRYSMVMPGGSTVGVTKGPNAANMDFCHECHIAGEESDYLFFLPEDFRK